jgi:hypothetical protein
LTYFGVSSVNYRELRHDEVLRIHLLRLYENSG